MVEEFTSEYLKFIEIPTGQKTKRWKIFSKSSGDWLGSIKWYGAWRQYCFFTDTDNLTIWNKGCLADIQKFIELNKDSRNT